NEKVSSAINSGSYAKHTAINTKFDIDICQPFRFDSFNSLEEMADSVYDFFLNEYDDDDLLYFNVKKQRVSTGLTFYMDGQEIKMDVVPGRELSEGDYFQTSKLNLYVRAKQNTPATYTQTNIKKHIEYISGKEQERNIIRLLKIWKNNKNKDIKSFFIELITIRAFENANQIPTSLWEQLKMVLEFIRDNIETIRLVDPANSNNVVSDTLSDIEKENLSNEMKNMLERIEENDELLRFYFTENESFAGEQKKTGASILSTKSFS
ncbi:hypothetical protein LJC25_01865, partial [Bacteroidales bacterium OttesenSCG-928-K03]|nr:hypothetical protein [Bacteroidales bacterium OttesenSCG-928-K03]